MTYREYAAELVNLWAKENRVTLPGGDAYESLIDMAELVVKLKDNGVQVSCVGDGKTELGVGE